MVHEAGSQVARRRANKEGSDQEGVTPIGSLSTDDETTRPTSLTNRWKEHNNNISEKERGDRPKGGNSELSFVLPHFTPFIGGVSDVIV